jgi:hypothetical protein
MRPSARSDIDPRCASCAKRIRFGGFVGTEDGKWFHLACRSEIRRVEDIEERDRASPPDTVCAACSKPIHSRTLALFEHGKWFHVGCRTSAVFDVAGLRD